MAINALRDGFVKFCIDTGLNVRDARCRFVVEGQMLATGTATPDTLVSVTRFTVDALFGAGSVLAVAMKKAMQCCGNNAVDFYAIPRADPVGGTAARYWLPVTSTATSDASWDIYFGESDFTISDVFIPEGSTNQEIAQIIADAAGDDLPFTVAANGSRVEFTANNSGTIGNGLTIIPIPRVAGGVTFGEIGVREVGAGELEPIDHASLFGECCVCCYALLSDDAALQRALQSYLEEQWDCETPQCFGHGYTYNSGSLGEVLARDTNAAVLSRMAHGDANPILPWLRVVAYAAQSCCTTIDNPEISVQGPNFGVLECIAAPESCFPEWTRDELLQLQDAGFVVTIPETAGSGAMASPMVVNDVTNNRFDADGRENLTFRSVSSRRQAVKTVMSLAERLQEFNGLSVFSRNTAIREGVQGTNQRLMLGELRAWAKENVGDLFSEFEDLNADLVLREDFEVAPRCQGQPGRFLLDLKYRPPVRMAGVSVNAQPELLTNC